MDKRKRNVFALGVLTVLAAVVFFWGFYYLLGTPVLKGGMDVVVRLEHGAGLKRGDRVLLNGVLVGSVRSVSLAGASGVIAVLRLNDKIDLPADTRARVSGDVFGAHSIELIPGTALVKLEPGDTILGGTQGPGLTEIAGELSTRATGLITRADSLLSPQTVRDLQNTASVLPGSAVELRAALMELRMATAALRRTTEEIETARSGEALRAVLNRVDSSAIAIRATALAMERSVGSLESVFRKIDMGQGTLGRLINDTTLFNELNGAAREIRVLAADVRARPRRYINLEIF
jgi:phospholipid/cholesterol/gamma-HCH transport system substrate-binding protein